MNIHVKGLHVKQHVKDCTQFKQGSNQPGKVIGAKKPMSQDRCHRIHMCFAKPKNNIDLFITVGTAEQMARIKQRDEESYKFC